VEPPQAWRLRECQARAGHFQILSANAVEDLIARNGDEVLFHAALLTPQECARFDVSFCALRAPVNRKSHQALRTSPAMARAGRASARERPARPPVQPLWRSP